MHQSLQRQALLGLLSCFLSSYPNPAVATVCGSGGDPVVNPCVSALVAAEQLTGSNPQLAVSNAAFSGACSGGAVVLSSGDARIATTISNTDAMKTMSHGTVSTDPDLAALSAATGYSQTLHDEALLSFDLTPTVSGPLAFQYVFGSEEYPFFAPSPGNPTQPNSNDIFGFFIWPSSGFPTNVAILPNSTTPVSIATVNALYNAYYVSNDFYSPPVPAIATELNGFTSLLKTNDYQVSAGTTYHVKLAIADGADDKWDTVVWIRAGSVRFNIKDCVGIWVPHTWGPSQGVCTGGCGGGPGLLPEAYFISVAAANGGNECPTVNGTTRLSTPCNNDNPCPINCTASWVENGNCTGQCSGGSGFTPKVFVVTSPAMYGGSCPDTNGTTRLNRPCNNTVPCPPRHCVGSWEARNCSGDCGGGEGLLLEEFVITVTGAYNGTECPATNGTTKLEQACNNTNPCPINCTGSFQVLNSSLCTGHCSGGDGFVPEIYHRTSGHVWRVEINCTNEVPCPPVDCMGVWLTAGVCNGSCGGGEGLLPKSFNITKQAAYGGVNCSSEQDELRLMTSCFNTTPCPIDCIGNWTLNGPCSGACAGGSGTWPERYAVTSAAQHGGLACPHAHNALRSVLECVNEAPCPVPCNFTWVQNGNCTGACGGGAGTLPERFIITDPALYGGTCPFANGTTRSTVPCSNTNACPPRNCVGSWTNDTACNGTCGGGAGLRRQKFTVTTTAAWGGQNCSEMHDSIRFVNCTNTICCPVNCVGVFVVTGNCTGACSGGPGIIPEQYNIIVPRSCSGATCPHAQNAARPTPTPCVNNVPCPPRNCVGSWVARNCSGACGGGAGLLLEEYGVTVTAAYNGTECPSVHGTTRSQEACNNTNPCPVNCTGLWEIPNANNCTGACDGGSGFITERFRVSQPALHGGLACSFTNNTMRSSQTGDAYKVPEPRIYKQGSSGFVSNPLFHPFANFGQSTAGGYATKPHSAATTATTAAMRGTPQQPTPLAAAAKAPPAAAPARLLMQQQASAAAELSLAAVLGGQPTTSRERPVREKPGRPRAGGWQH